MIDIINQFLKNLDYKYINFIRKIKFVFNEKFFIFYMYRILKPYLPYIISRLNRKIEIFIHTKIYIYFFNKYLKIKYTIFNYPKHYNNFKFLEYIKKTIKNDYIDIIDYYFNIFNLSKWRYNILMLIILLWFYSLLLLSNNLLYFIIIKLSFYTVKYILKYIFIIIDYFFYTYLHFTRMPKFFVGFLYILLIKNLYRLYYIIFNILPLLVYVGYWWTLIENFRDLIIRKINKFLDIIEFCIVRIAKSYLFVLIKQGFSYLKYYLLEEDKLKELVERKKVAFKNFYQIYIIHNIISYINLRYFYYIKFISKNFFNRKNMAERITDIRIYTKYIYPYIDFNVKVKLMSISYFFRLYYIKFEYKYKRLVILFDKKFLELYWKYFVIYNFKNILLRYTYNLYVYYIYIYNIIIISYLYINLYRI